MSTHRASPVRRPLLLGFAALVGLTMFATACSSGGATATGSQAGSTSSSPIATTAPPSGGSTGLASGADPCQLVTSEEADSLLGASAQRTGPTEENSLLSCKWDTGQGANLLVSVAQGAAFYDASLYPGSKPVAGLGDKAFSDAQTQTVGFLQGDTVVILYVPALYKLDIADLEALARTVAGRL
jgi:hypothetical protein